MRSTLGFVAAGAVALAFGISYACAVRRGAGWFDSQWLFLVALPYNWTMLKTTGVANFSPDAPAEVATAFAFEAALGYLAGALVAALLRGLWLGLGRLRRRA